ncbi:MULTISPECIES: molybdenum cofactor biosynthesis protein MoaE [Sphingobium]|uniref:Molybdopterin synthase catalytic subunit n=1 Tax=Sphingobium chungbukense TaxID=56193 RepID=A0A0M3AIB7_9SPHN|nr:MULTISPECIES: molybdenum cofactor biosynthesis protein MoaE [Sphingobium]KKW89595.1 molybdopterin synthase catalytic subunit [Sphingobium chungbukense]PJG49222.1 molybdopterin synthase catalytic subunit [Sphingobium sp. LB126]
MSRVSIQAEDFDPAAELAALEASGGGGVASFTGIVRGEGGLVALELEHYPAMTTAQVERIVGQALDRWPLLGVRVIHRHGRLEPGERIVFVGTASRHRTAALEACAFLIDWLKSEAPFWKKEHFADRTQWVEARAEDDAKAESWKR